MFNKLLEKQYCLMESHAAQKVPLTPMQNGIPLVPGQFFSVDFHTYYSLTKYSLHSLIDYLWLKSLQLHLVARVKTSTISCDFSFAILNEALARLGVISVSRKLLFFVRKSLPHYANVFLESHFAVWLLFCNCTQIVRYSNCYFLVHLGCELYV